MKNEVNSECGLMATRPQGAQNIQKIQKSYLEVTKKLKIFFIILRAAYENLHLAFFSNHSQ
jgi:hypothetical protein